jgi:hypothetical protein
MIALEATGMGHWQAFGAAAEAFGPEAVRPGWDRFLRRARDSRKILEVLDRIAEHGPLAANALLNDILADGRLLPWVFMAAPGFHLTERAWLTSVPHRSAGWDNLYLDDSGVRDLPNGMVVNGWLSLTRSPIVTLPEGLRVGQGLAVDGCGRWDGRVPADLSGEADIISDAHPEGTPLALWRAEHPHGERE